jgi:CHAD domain-containing protein
LKRHLDTFHDLRDTHVQLLSLKPLRKRYAAVAEFEAYLQKREKRFTRRTQRAVKRIKTRRLGKCVDLWREDITALCAGASAVKAHSLVLNGLRTAFGKTALLKSRINPVETRTIHRTRVAFKKFRYMVEDVQTLLLDLPASLIERMHDYQTLMGTIQDATVILQSLVDFAETTASYDPFPVRRYYERILAHALSVYMQDKNDLLNFWRATPLSEFPWETGVLQKEE